MIIAYGLLVPSIVLFIFGIFIAPIYNKQVSEGKIKEIIYYTERDSKEIIILYIIILCCLQFIFG